MDVQYSYWELSCAPILSWITYYTQVPFPDPFEEDRLRLQLHDERANVADLQSAVSIERQKSLEWMERHNRERDSRYMSIYALRTPGTFIVLYAFFIFCTKICKYTYIQHL